MKRSRILVAVSFVALASTVAVAWAGAGPASERVSSPRELRGVNFVSGCGFSHRAPDDPIVFPRKPGFSHDHTFVGNQSTNAFSTLRTLRAATTTCRRAGDTAAYWAPTLIAGTRAVEPLGATIYYRRRSLGDVTAFPAGLKMIAGDQHAMRPQSLRVTFWNCGVMAGLPPSSTVPTCPAGRATSLRLHVLFPDCWNGKTLDSADHKRHMAYSVRGQCPASHPVAVPAIALILRYPSFGGPNLQLSSGGQLSGHADFFNAWDQAELTRLVDTCLNALRHCGRES